MLGQVGTTTVSNSILSLPSLKPIRMRLKFVLSYCYLPCAHLEVFEPFDNDYVIAYIIVMALLQHCQKATFSKLKISLLSI